MDLFLRPDQEPELVDRLGLASARASGQSRDRHGRRDDGGRPDGCRGRGRAVGYARGRGRGRRRAPALERERVAADHLRLRQDLHLLHRAVQPRARAQPAVRRHRRGGAVDCRAGLPGGHALGQNVNSYGHDLQPEARSGTSARSAGRAGSSTWGRGRTSRSSSGHRRPADCGRDERDPAPPVHHVTSVGPLGSADRRDGRLPVRL